MSNFYFEVTADAAFISRERNRARDLKKTQWWQNKLNQGICESCGVKVGRDALTMDHIVPLARGGHSTKGNISALCKGCNQSKKLATPVDLILGS